MPNDETTEKVGLPPTYAAWACLNDYGVPIAASIRRTKEDARFVGALQGSEKVVEVLIRVVTERPIAKRWEVIA